MKARYEKAQKFLSTLAGQCPELPFEPTLLPELFASTAGNSMSSVTHIAGLVERSQGLATRILRMANSAYYGMNAPVSSLSHAIRLLGVNEVRAIILQLGVTAVIRQLKLPKIFPVREIWEHQIFTACLARMIAQSMPAGVPAGEEEVSPDELYAAGLLHDLGKTMVAAHCPDDWLAINDLAACEGIPYFQAEEDYWGIDHSVAGARLLAFWGLPVKLTELVGWHHAPVHGPVPYKTPIHILAAANLLSRHQAAPANAEEDAADADPIPDNVRAILPGTVDHAKLRIKLAEDCDMDRVKGMAQAALVE